MIYLDLLPFPRFASKLISEVAIDVPKAIAMFWTIRWTATLAPCC